MMVEKPPGVLRRHGQRRIYVRRKVYTKDNGAYLSLVVVRFSPMSISIGI